MWGNALPLDRMTTSAAVRRQLVQALKLDLVGPDSQAEDHYQNEILSQAPSKWYLTGFLVPYEASVQERSDEAGDDELELPEPKGFDDETTPEQASARRAPFPSSIGLSFLVSDRTTTLTTEISWGDYFLITPPPGTETQAKDSKEKTEKWQRKPQLQHLSVSLSNSTKPITVDIPHSNGLKLAISNRPVQGTTKLPPGTKAISVFLVNHRQPKPDAEKDSGSIFQAQLTIHNSDGFIPRPDLRNQRIDDDDERIADLQYRDDYEFAVGHNVSALVFPDANSHCSEIRTAWIPTAEVEKVIATDLPTVELAMETIAAAETADDIRSLVSPMVAAYAAWITQQSKIELTNATRAGVAVELMHRATIVNQRIAAGLKALDDPNVLDAFRIANQAIATAIRQRSTHNSDKSPTDLKPPKWRPFQLAFLLMNLVGIEQPNSSDREIVDLLFFPTGGGKTEAYLGLAAFTLVLRRLRNPGISGAGLSVLMRYTLRLLTLDQLGRAATLVCALEIERSKDTLKLGVWPFEIGLWVGRDATPNEMGERGDKKDNTARQRTIDYTSGRKPNSPIPLDICPWCGTAFTKQSFQLQPTTDNPTDLKITCASRKCHFRGNQFLPIVTVDDAIYRRLPCFLIATVDKFASLPWVGRTAGLFGKVSSYGIEGFYGSATPEKVGGQKLSSGLLPPDLIIQDELHLISGPLGTMVGLYETAIETLSCRMIDGRNIKPKIVASTATVRRATSQIRALFGRDQVEVFPPPGSDRRDSFFAQTVSSQDRNARQYVGISAQGRSLKVVLLRTYLVLLGAAQKIWLEEKGARNQQNPVDPYMTLVGYFNSLRELGGSRRIVEDEVRSRLSTYGKQKRETEEVGNFADRKIADDPLELTSRVSTSQVAEAKSRLEKPFIGEDRKNAVDVVLATNMISVGLDITRLGLMVVLGQPKTTAEYIQATSRVGRDEERPGLVITLMNIHRPRDRSHYERFQAWHKTFYRAVEATSVTPFSPRAIDRGLAGVSVALARLGCDQLTAPKQAVQIGQQRQKVEFVAEDISNRAAMHDKDLTPEDSEALRLHLKSAVTNLFDDWENLAREKGKLQYQKEVGDGNPPLLYDPLDPELQNLPTTDRKFKAQRSLRDVEQSVSLWIQRPDGQDFGDES
jgi:Helicase conserved C-terminal domain